MATYIVQRGDTFNAIARKFGVTPDELGALNPQVTNRDRINPGDVLNIPGGELQGSTDMSLHVVANEMGVIFRGSGGVSCDRGNAGVYNVTFTTQVISGWAWHASIGSGDVSAVTPGLVTTQLLGNSGRIIQVRTFDDAGNAADRPFHLSVHEI
ncbi:LysM peptidoglycan-binding domain-containing protein [Actinomycetospora sp. NBC_00405]|uniref:LysM peptidoglycan-binding domain-containing protein n=1 Tax=Actinomycetospora sp. NBC_00405 TaxID=2975952 RepID=UPI002E1DD3F2